VRFKVKKFLNDLPIERSEIPAVMRRSGQSLHDSAISHWIRRGRIPMGRIVVLQKEAKRRGKDLRIEAYVNVR
jgi:hypothetical protein